MNATAFDFGSVSVSEAELPQNGAGRPRKHDVNPFTEILAASYEAFQNDQNPGRQIVVPGKNSAEAVYLLRQAGEDLGIGVRIVLRNSKGETLTAQAAKEARGNVTVMFAGKNRKQKAQASETPETDTEPETVDA